MSTRTDMTFLKHCRLEDKTTADFDNDHKTTQH